MTKLRRKQVETHPVDHTDKRDKSICNPVTSELTIKKEPVEKTHTKKVPDALQ